MYGPPPARNPMYGPTPKPEAISPPGKLPWWIRTSTVQVGIVIAALVVMFAFGWLFATRWNGDHHPIQIEDVRPKE